MLVQQQVAEIGLCGGEIRSDRKRFTEAFVGFRGLMLLRSNDPKQRPCFRIAGMPLQKQLQSMSCVGKATVLEKTTSMLDSVGGLRPGGKCGRKQSDRRTLEHENEDSLHRKKKAWALSAHGISVPESIRTSNIQPSRI
jgi:hypothetical protein